MDPIGDAVDLLQVVGDDTASGGVSAAGFSRRRSRRGLPAGEVSRQSHIILGTIYQDCSPVIWEVAVDAIAGPVQGRRDPPRVRHIIASCLVLCSGIFLTLAWTLPHVWVMLGGLSVAGIAVMLIPPFPKWPRVVVTVVVIGAVLYGSQLSSARWPDESSWETSINGATQLILALDRYAADHDRSYPVSIHSVLSDGYLGRLPDNFYCGGNYRDIAAELTDEERQALLTMQPIGDNDLPDELRQNSDLAGNFVYLPRIVTDGGGGYTATGYSLLVFGRKRWEPGEWDKAYTMPTVAFYYNSETGVQQTWK